MPKRIGWKKRVAEEIATPIILKLLKPFSGEDMARAIRDNLDLAEVLEGNPEYLNRLRLLVSHFPFTEQIAKRVADRRWIRWFVENALRHRRRDLYVHIAYTPKGFSYIVRQIRKIVKLVFQA